MYMVGIYWLVVYLLLWKIWKSVRMMKFPIYGKTKNVPNHQPVYIYIYPSQQNPGKSQGQLGNPGFSNKTQGFATLTKIFFWSIQPRSFVSKHQQPQASSISKNTTNTNHDRMLFWGIQRARARIISRVITGESWVHHGFVTGLEKHRVFPKARVSRSKPVGKPQVDRQTRQNTRVLLVRVYTYYTQYIYIYWYIYIHAIKYTYQHYSLRHITTIHVSWTYIRTISALYITKHHVNTI